MNPRIIRMFHTGAYGLDQGRLPGLPFVPLAEGRDRNVFGRRALPVTGLASVSCPIQCMWLAARTEGLGMGRMSTFDPVKRGALLSMPADARQVAVGCLGQVEAFCPKPMFELEHWADRMPLEAVLAENAWPAVLSAREGRLKAGTRPD